MQNIKIINDNQLDSPLFAHRYVGCLILTQDKQLLLQQRGKDWNRYPGYLCEFGGRIEAGELPIQALIRELAEELGAKVIAEEVVYMGAITEASSQHTELIYTYFWQDRRHTITGCYEGEARYYPNTQAALDHPRLMESVRWLLMECQRQRHIS